MKEKKFLFICILLLISLSVCGCESISLTEEEEQIYVDYAVNAVINHDNNYILKLKDVEIESETETFWYSEDGTRKEAESGEEETTVQGNGQEEETTSLNIVTDMNSVLNIQGIDVTYKDFLMCKSYPESDEMAFEMNAVEGSNLIIIELNVKNITESDINLDMLSKSIKFKGIFNGQVRTNCQTTLLINAFNTYNGVIAAGETKELVLVFEANEKSISSISTIKLEITNGDLSDTVILKK